VGEKIRRGLGDISTAPGLRYVKLTKVNTDLADGPCRCLLVGTAGSANLMESGGEQRANVPLVKGYNPLVVRQLRTGGTADDIWAVY
jgi:hypothetical protein